MKKLVLSLAAAAALAGSAFTLTAIAAPDGPGGPGAERMAEPGFLFGAKLAGMKAALKLTADQEKLWPAFESAVQDANKARMEAMKSWRDEREGAERPSPVAMMTEMSDHLAKASEELKKIADALQAALRQPRRRPEAPLRPAAAHAARGRPAFGRLARRAWSGRPEAALTPRGVARARLAGDARPPH